MKKILPFEGDFSIGSTEPEAEPPRDELLALLDGYCTESKGPQLVQKLFASFANRSAAAETVRGVLEKYLSYERPFAQSIGRGALELVEVERYRGMMYMA